MKKRVILLFGGIISLVLYLFWAITFIVWFRDYPYNSNYLIQFLIITGLLLIPGIFGVIENLKKHILFYPSLDLDISYLFL
jgi:hypothetical protein